MPQEYGCHFRRNLLKTINQPELERKNIWYIDPEAKYLDAAMNDVKQAVIKDALPWFASFTNLSDVYSLLLNQEENLESGTWGFGNKDSPIRNYLTGYVALALGDYGPAVQALQNAIESGCYESIKPQLEMVIKQATN